MHPTEVAREVKKYWQTKYHKPRKVDAEKFIEKYERYMRKLPKVDLRAIDVKRLRRALKRMNKDRAVALDGWSVRELEAMPDELLNEIAKLMNDVEAGKRKWPRKC